MKPIVNRLRRIEGQITSLEASLESGMVCSKVIPQFLAVKGALDAALQQYLKQSIAECKEGKSAKEIGAILDLVVKKLS
jgi:DNA-binding FrmR family transcriptional regulator